MIAHCSSAPLQLSFHVLAWSIAIHLLLGTALAWLLARKRFAGRAVLDALLSLPLVFPPIVLGYFLLLLLGRQGWLTQSLPPALQPEIVFSQTGLVLASCVAGLPLFVKPVQAAFAGTPQRLREAAALLGHGPWSVFWRVELPLARRGLAAGLVLAGGRSLGEVGLSLMLGGNIAGRTETLSLAIYNHVLDGNHHCANTLSLVLAALALLAFVILRRWGAL
ncbi:molybdate ABC transporter permease subunit [Vandammella animalimorsus]|uniref:Molybdenum transport system permease n=1 Tax=Vandammella animalimorsus TaxID=2029117 RepID=A0A2A2AUZ6_9BURK|nr:molybdate ABC transporter permease subunit [Vandammella animalimorsus]PAT41676.1 molybdate ABC transporter permease subunit [Vandammella animalimorsus]